MIDFHTHILPGIDDGSSDAEMSVAMLRKERDQGVEEVIATPHFDADRASVSSFLKRRSEALEKLERAANKESPALPKVRCGAEVYYFAGIGKALRVKELCVEQTHTLLLELPFRPWDKEVLRDVEALIKEQALTVVLAHVERYLAFQKDHVLWKEMLALPAVPQINAGNFLTKDHLFRRDRKKQFCLDLLREHPGVILGSDCHNLTSRRPNLAEGRAAIADALGEEPLRRTDAVTRRVLEA